MRSKSLRSDALLLLTASIWGFAFVAQRVGMEYIGPFTFNGVRFALGALSLIPLLYLNRRQSRATAAHRSRSEAFSDLKGGALAGLALFIGASLQQIGIVYTTAGKAGFITGLYVVIVPILGVFWRQRTGKATWGGAILASIGLYFLSITGEFTIAFGDLLVLLGAFFWAGHVLIIGWLSPRIYPVKLACLQFAACSILSLITAFFTETATFRSLMAAAAPILYGGLFSVGVAYTLQVVAQRDARPAHASIILSLEAVFAALGGWLLLNETLSGRGLLGCSLMLAGMLISQLRAYFFRAGT